MTADTTTEPGSVADFDVIVPPTGKVIIAGHECRVRRLKTLEVMALLRVVTAGMGEGIGSIKLSKDNSEIGAQFTALILMSVPAAPGEMIALIRRLLEPVGILSDEQRKAFDDEISNPDLETLMAVVMTIAAQEQDDMVELLGKARTMWAHLSALYRTGRKGS